MARTAVVVSAGVKLYLNGKPYGNVTEFSWTSATPRRAIYGLDVTEPCELAPTTTRVAGNVEVIRTVGDGGAEGAGITATYPDLSAEKYFTLQLIERKSDTVIFEARYCSLVSQSWQAPLKGVVSGSLDFEALEWNNELRRST